MLRTRVRLHSVLGIRLGKCSDPVFHVNQAVLRDKPCRGSDADSGYKPLQRFYAEHQSYLQIAMSQDAARMLPSTLEPSEVILGDCFVVKQWAMGTFVMTPRSYRANEWLDNCTAEIRAWLPSATSKGPTWAKLLSSGGTE